MLVCVCVCVVTRAVLSSQQREVCKACYLVIESYLKGDSRKNENYLARFIKFFQQQVLFSAMCHNPLVSVCVCVCAGWDGSEC